MSGIASDSTRLISPVRQNIIRPQSSLTSSIAVLVSSRVPCSQGLRNEPKEPVCARTAAEWSDLSVSCVFRWQTTKQMRRKNNWKQKKCSVPVEWHLQLTSFFKTTGLISLYKKVQYDWESVGQSALEGKGAGIVRNLIVTPFWAK